MVNGFASGCLMWCVGSCIVCMFAYSDIDCVGGSVFVWVGFVGVCVCLKKYCNTHFRTNSFVDVCSCFFAMYVFVCGVGICFRPRPNVFCSSDGMLISLRLVNWRFVVRSCIMWWGRRNR